MKVILFAIIGVVIGQVVEAVAIAAKRGDRMYGITDIPWYTEGEKMKNCKDCRARCTGIGREGNANQCSYYTTEGPGKLKRGVRILEITCCDDCLYYDINRGICTRGAMIEGELFFEDCPLEKAYQSTQERLGL